MSEVAHMAHRQKMLHTPDLGGMIGLCTYGLLIGGVTRHHHPHLSRQVT